MNIHNRKMNTVTKPDGGTIFRFSSTVFVCLLTLTQPNTSLAGSTGYLGGPGGKGFGTVSCPESEQRIIGLTAAMTNEGSNTLMLGVRAICKTMDGSGNWSGQNFTTKFQKGISSFGNSTEYSSVCPDNMWVGGLAGGTKKAGIHPVLAEIDVHCYKSTGTGKRKGSQNTIVIVSQPATSAGNLFCPGGEIARGIYGKSGSHLDSVGFKCIEARANKAPRRQSRASTDTQFGWARGMTQEEVQRFNLSVDQADSVSQLTGKTMKDVLTGDAVVRPDGITCVGCHSSGSSGATFKANTTRREACAELSDFRHASKPDNLKLLFKSWLRGRCR